MEKKPKSTRIQNAETLLRSTLSRANLRGQIITVEALCREMKRGRDWFYENIGRLRYAQVWFEINDDGPLDAKVHYKNMLDTELAKETSSVKIETGKKKVFVSKETAKEVTQKLGALRIKKSGEHKDLGKVTTETSAVEVIEVSEKDALINKIRELFVMAPLGDMPNVKDIMVNYGVIDKEGKSLMLGLTEEEVRLRARNEGWKEQRGAQLHTAMDLLPEEIKMITMVRNVETQKVLFNELKMMHRMNQQYWAKGRVRSADGMMDLEYKPSPGDMAGIAEVMRRMVDGGGNVNVLNIQVNNQVNNTLSGVTRTYLGKLQNMTPDQVQTEIIRFNQLSGLLNGEPEPLTMEQIEAQGLMEKYTEEALETDEE